MPSLVTLVFSLTYLGMALGRVPGLKLDREGLPDLPLLDRWQLAKAALGTAVPNPAVRDAAAARDRRSGSP